MTSDQQRAFRMFQLPFGSIVVACGLAAAISNDPAVGMAAHATGLLLTLPVSSSAGAIAHDKIVPQVITFVSTALGLTFLCLAPAAIAQPEQLGWIPALFGPPHP